ncbi:hypothetical protein [Prosthecobacter sp.]|uniref:hypothetical protein n=1 Tax=Prosthecobacter sp. TaxID=1965333 RepID=UPI0024898EA3|nr:hypothetical protein [Prosthecobacter sp.]MDI1315139.1 hypothetical protein [Prosthecobacter sp.]
MNDQSKRKPLTNADPSGDQKVVQMQTRHRGLTIEEMPTRGGSKQDKQYLFALFKKRQWPPVEWKVPMSLKGAALMIMLEERSTMFGVQLRAKTGMGKF